MKDKRRLRLGRLASLGLVGLGLGCAAIPDGLDPAKPHHTPTGFTNPGPYDPPGGLDFLRWQWRRLGKDIPGPEAYDFPLAKGDAARLQEPAGRTALTWIGHSTLLLQLEGRNILTDPHFSKRASPVPWAGPERVVPPGVALKDLPPIHLVLISHNHYDHLDTPTIRKL
ncbi:MAG: MBL fold metallo-hydrolase, partial [Candidatus Competibacteraceae bacterium]|nr:MBL fold metallo-hydrolase [Candidatus Competibacteraceae bacterium]